MSLKCLLLPLYSATQCTFSSCPLNIFHVPTELNILSCLSVGMSQMNKNHAIINLNYRKPKLCVSEDCTDTIFMAKTSLRAELHFTICIRIPNTKNPNCMTYSGHIKP